MVQSEANVFEEHGGNMEPSQTNQPVSTAVVHNATQTVNGTPVVHVVQPDVYLVQRANDNFWSTQATPLAAILSVVLTIVAKWIWDRRAQKYELRRKLYLDLADAISEANATLAAFAEPNISLEMIKERFIKSSGVISKVEVVAPDKLLKALADLNDEGGKAFLELLRARLPIEKSRVDISTNEPFIQAYQADIDAVLAEQKRMNIDNVRDPERFARLHSQYEFSRDQRAELVAQNKEAAESLNAAAAQIVAILMAKQLALLPHMERVKQLTRNDLGFKYDYEGNLNRKLSTATKAQEEFNKTQKAVAETFTSDTVNKPDDKTAL